ncbi:MAG: hypothetical protein HYX67_17425 [Candidatus Melainabacteria bacterium]|nr:hypothetical protein [Candidatus Melainabacteria bacterium]
MLSNKTTDGASAYVSLRDEPTSAAKFQAEYFGPGLNPKFAQSSSNCVAEIAKSAVNAAIVDPVRAVAQVVDNTCNSSYDKQLQIVANSFGLTPSTPAEFGTARYF